MAYHEILDFWFSELQPRQWWIKDDELDGQIRERFRAVHRQAQACELFTWRGFAAGRLAEIIVLDQFSRNMYRGRPDAFACDPQALILAQEAVAAGIDGLLESQQRSFVYMPYMHSESLLIHDQAVVLFERSGNASALDYEYRHKAILERFGRYPHRNETLGRVSTAEELEFLKQPGSGF